MRRLRLPNQTVTPQLRPAPEANTDLTQETVVKSTQEVLDSVTERLEKFSTGGEKA